MFMKNIALEVEALLFKHSFTFVLSVRTINATRLDKFNVNVGKFQI